VTKLISIAFLTDSIVIDLHEDLGLQEGIFQEVGMMEEEDEE
jgi:hypothetical protein